MKIVADDFELDRVHEDQFYFIDNSIGNHMISYQGCLIELNSHHLQYQTKNSVQDPLVSSNCTKGLRNLDLSSVNRSIKVVFTIFLQPLNRLDVIGAYIRF